MPTHRIEAADVSSTRTGQLVPSRQLLDAARATHTAVAALNFYNAETLRAHIDAANGVGRSIILQTTESTIRYLGIELAVGLAHAAARVVVKPVALHLDHGSSAELAFRCIDAGYSSVMIDGSKLPFDENVAVTLRVVERARAAGVSVEGELGFVAHNDDAGAAGSLTEPADAARFVAETGVDALAVAIGTAHGFYKAQVRLDLDRLERIRDAVGGTALVLHGGSGVPDELLDQAIARGITKINFGTEIKDAFMRAIRTAVSASGDIDLRRVFAPAVDAVRQVSAAKIQLCGRQSASHHEAREGRRQS